MRVQKGLYILAAVFAEGNVGRPKLAIPRSLSNFEGADETFEASSGLGAVAT